MASLVSFQGLSSGIQTDALINAILQQEGTPLQRLKNHQTLNSRRVTALNTLRRDMTALSTSLTNLGSTGLISNKVTSTDTNSTYASVTASGAAVGTYDLKVNQVATKGRISATLDGGGAPTNLAVADPSTTSIFGGGSATFAVRGTDGVIKTLTLGSGNNSLNGLRDAINASGAGVTASIVNTGTGANPYQLVLTAKDTGTGTTSGVVTLADVTSGGAVNTLGITAGTVDDLVTPTTLTGGLQSAEAAKDAQFVLNGITLTRKSNVVTDAISGVTLTLKQGGQTSASTLNVAMDDTAATAAMQDVISKYNALLSDYKAATTVTKDSNGDAVLGPLNGVPQAEGFINQIKAALTGAATGLGAGAAFKSPADLGVATQRDGTLSLNTTTFQAAFAKDSAAVARVFNASGTSTNAAVAFSGSSTKTTTGDVTFNITSFVSGGAISGTINVGGTDYAVTGSNGVVQGGVGTPLEGLILTVSGTGSGTLTLSRGVGQTTRDTLSDITAAVTGGMSLALQAISDQNTSLQRQVDLGQARLDRRQEVLKAQFSRMEAAIAQLKRTTGSLSGLG